MRATDPELIVREATPRDSSLLEAFFAQADVPCHCRYWEFRGTSNEWLDRCANRPFENRAEFEEALRDSARQVQGVLAEHGEKVVGWLKLTRARSMEKLYQQRLYRGLPCFAGDRDGVMTVGCFLVARPWRRHGVARRLIGEAIHIARARGASSLEAFPRRAEGVDDAELWMGPYAAFVEAGFETVSDFAPYPVLRLELT
jgi:GNAT superfamily N-acetyltransferase